MDKKERIYMNIKDYLKDKINLLLVYYISIILVMLISVLAAVNKGYIMDIKNILYGLLLASIIISLYLFLDYKKTNKFLRIIKEGNKNPEDIQYVFNLPDGINNQMDIIRDGFINNYKYYIENLEEYKRNSKMQLDFNNRWIHEMKTPVSVMKLIVEKEKSNIEDKSIRDRFNSIEEEMDKLSNGLEMALYTLRINDFQNDFKIEEIELIELIRDVINENKSTFIINSVYPKILYRDEIHIITDKKWIRFVIRQILNNSIKYTKIKDIEDKKIIIDIVEEKEKIYLIIEDNGIGIIETDINRLFDPFFTGENGRRYKDSTGMGLYLVREVLDRLGHNIEIESEEGEGTKIKIVFYKGKSIYNI